MIVHDLSCFQKWKMVSDTAYAAIMRARVYFLP